MRVTIIDLVSASQHSDLFSRKMNPSFASIMPQAVAVWCEELGHQVRYICYCGDEDLTGPAGDTDILIVSAFTRAAFLSYAVSAHYRANGAVTALGGPHARCYPEDAGRYFDYVFGFTGKAQVEELLLDAAPHRPFGRSLSALTQPTELPSLRQRWKFVQQALAKSGPIRIIPTIGSVGCPYACGFCIDSTVDYQPFDFDGLRDDMAFLARSVHRPLVGWHDPNFGVRFDRYMEALEQAAPPGTIRHIAEMSLSLLSDSNLDRLKAAGFVGMLPGIESWFAYGNKSRTTRVAGEEKVRQVADHVNRILDRIPFVQANVIFGLDSDEGAEPFELTKRFLDQAPGVYPGFALLTAFGRASQLNLELQRAGRLNAMPFQFLDGNHGMNVRPRNYEWSEFYRHVAGVMRHAQGPRAIARRLKANGPGWAGAFNAVRAGTAGRSRYDAEFAELLRGDKAMRAFLDGETRLVPNFFVAHVRRALGRYWDALPAGAIEHDPYAYLASQPREAA